MKKSFTLIELLIVLVIIGILATLAVPQYQKWVRRTQAAEAKQLLGILSDSLWRYYMEKGDFPESLADSLPTDLDVNIPTETRYFRYQYFKWATAGCQIEATYKDNINDLDNGEVIAYDIWFNASQNWFGSVGQPMGIWYKHFMHLSKTSSGQELKAGWP